MLYVTFALSVLTGGIAVGTQPVEFNEKSYDELYISTESGVRAILKEKGTVLKFFPDQLIPQDFPQELSELGVNIDGILKTDLSVTGGEKPRSLLLQQGLVPGYDCVPYGYSVRLPDSPGPLKSPGLSDFHLALPTTITPLRIRPSLEWRKVASDEEPSIIFLEDEIHVTTQDGVECQICPVQEEEETDGLRLTILKAPYVESFVKSHEMVVDLENIKAIPPFLGHYLENLGIQIRKITSLYCNETVRKIGGAAFSNFYSLRTIHVPPTLTTVESFSFAHTGILDLDLSGLPNLVAIGRYAFTDTPIRSVIWPPALVQIGAYAFSHCLLEHVSAFPQSLTKVGAHAFSDNPDLKELVFMGEELTISSWAFLGNKNLSTLYFPYAKSLFVASSSISWIEPLLKTVKRITIVYDGNMKKEYNKKDRVFIYERP